MNSIQRQNAATSFPASNADRTDSNSLGSLALPLSLDHGHIVELNFCKNATLFCSQLKKKSQDLVKNLKARFKIML